MVQQKPMQATISVLERMDVDEAESEGRSGENGVVIERSRPSLVLRQSFDERREILVPRADVVRIWLPERGVTADEPSCLS